MMELFLKGEGFESLVQIFGVAGDEKPAQKSCDLLLIPVRNLEVVIELFRPS